MDNTPETQVGIGEFQIAVATLCLCQSCPLYEIWYMHCSLSDLNSSCRPASGVAVCHSRKSEWMSGVIICVLSTSWDRGTAVAHIRDYYSWKSGVIICVLSISWDRGTAVAHIRDYYRACNGEWLLGASAEKAILGLISFCLTLKIATDAL